MGLWDKTRSLFGLGKSEIVEQAADYEAVRCSLKSGFTNPRQFPAFMRCTAILQQTIASLPLKCYRRVAKGDPIEESCPPFDAVFGPYALLAREHLLAQLIENVVMHGNGYVGYNAAAERKKTVYMSDATKIKQEWQDGSISYKQDSKKLPYAILNFYLYPSSDNPFQGESLRYRATSVIHNAGLINGYTGSILENNGMNSAVVKSDSMDLQGSIEEKKRLREYIVKTVRDNKGGMFVLPPGYDMHSLNPNLKDLSFIELYTQQNLDICRVFGVPPVLVFEMTKNTSWGSGVSEMNRHFLTYGLMPWIVNLEKAINRFFVDINPDNADYYVKFNLSAFLRPTPKDQAEILRRYAELSVISIEEIRRLNDWGERNEADTYLFSKQLQTAKQFHEGDHR